MNHAKCNPARLKLFSKLGP